MSFKSLALSIVIVSAFSIIVLFSIYCGILAGSGLNFEEANQSFHRMSVAFPMVMWLRNIGVWGAIAGGLLWILFAGKRQ